MVDEGLKRPLPPKHTPWKDPSNACLPCPKRSHLAGQERWGMWTWARPSFPLACCHLQALWEAFTTHRDGSDLARRNATSKPSEGPQGAQRWPRFGKEECGPELRCIYTPRPYCPLPPPSSPRGLGAHWDSGGQARPSHTLPHTVTCWELPILLVGPEALTPN